MKVYVELRGVPVLLSWVRSQNLVSVVSSQCTLITSPVELKMLTHKTLGNGVLAKLELEITSRYSLSDNTFFDMDNLFMIVPDL